MSKRTIENKGKAKERKAQARVRIGSYYIGYREASQASVEYQNYKAKRGFKLPKIINTHFLDILNRLLGRPQMEPVTKEGGDA